VCGASLNGDLVVKFGGAADILLSSDKPVKDRRLYIDHHIVPGLFFSNGCMPDRLRAKVTKGAAPGALFKQDDLDWDAVKVLRDRWPGKLVLKGILHPEDAELALALGADGVVVSNHGGRALDCSCASLEALPDIVGAVGGRITVLLDSGVRRGSDVVKAVALGADAVLAGRAPLYGLAAAGEAGVSRAFELLRAETARTMAMLGARSVAELDSSLLR
jgi:isopentenyl diphosphate isomerase/L-lactate dehydrogenase-like FMN-dependent dehydrogenase